jgi:WD40 repeat protein
MTIHRILSVMLVLFLASCASTRTKPSIYLQSADMTMELHRAALGITDLAISKDGTLLLTSDTGGMGARKVDRETPGAGTIRLWDLVHGKQIRALSIEDIQEVFAVSISPDGRYALVGGTSVYKDGTGLIVCDLATGARVKEAPDVGDDVMSASFSPDGRYILVTVAGSCWGRFGIGSPGTDPKILLFNASTGKKIREFQTTYKDRSMTAAGSLKSVVAAFSPDGKYILSGGYDVILRLWDVETGEQIRQFAGHSNRFDDRFGITGIAISSNSRYALTCAEHDSSARLWDMAAGTEIRNLAGLDVYGMGFLAAWGVALSPDDKRALITALPLGVWDVATGKQEVLLQLNRPRNVYVIQNTKSMSGVYSPNGKTVLLHTNDASVRIFDTSTGKEIAMLVGFDDGEWIIITSEGYYNASERGAQYLTANLGGIDYSVEMFYDVFYRPDIVMATLRGEDVKDLVTLTMNSAVKNPPPVIEFTSIPSDAGQRKSKVCYRAKSNGGGIGEVRLFHNGKLIQSDGYYREVARPDSDRTKLASLNSKAIYDDMRSIAIKGAVETPVQSQTKGDVFEACSDVEAVPGDNEVSVTAFNRSNTVQSYMKTVNFTSRLKPEEPHLYILSVGIDRYRYEKGNLKYAGKDAGDIREKLLSQSRTIFKPENIHNELLTNEQATSVNITGKIDELSKVIKPTDGFILFVAGHGVLLQNQYYMLTHDFDGSITEKNSISSNAIIEISKKIKSLSQLFIFDTCHAGGVDTIVSGLYDARMSVLAKKMGLHIYASASDKQAAMDGYKGNGLFTYTLLDGLNNNKEADKNKDGKVTVVGLGEYAKKTTTNISKQIGHEQTPLIINFGKDNPIYKLQ